MRLDERRTCAKRGCSRQFTPRSLRHKYCGVHKYRKKVGLKHNARYGQAHRRLRAQWATRVAAGVVDCARCGERIEPGAAWDLGHVDGGLAYSGPEHAECNRATAATRLAPTSGALQPFALPPCVAAEPPCLDAGPVAGDALLAGAQYERAAPEVLGDGRSTGGRQVEPGGLDDRIADVDHSRPVAFVHHDREAGCTRRLRAVGYQPEVHPPRAGPWFVASATPDRERSTSEPDDGSSGSAHPGEPRAVVRTSRNGKNCPLFHLGGGAHGRGGCSGRECPCRRQEDQADDDCGQDTCAHGELMLSGLSRSLQTVVDPHCVLAEQDAAKLLPRARAGVPMVRLE
jgi:hypothetical protein